MQKNILTYATPASPAPRRRLLSAPSLLLLVPAASLGTLAGLKWGPGTIWGQSTYLACKIILLLIPTLWFLLERRGRSTSAAARTFGNFKFGTLEIRSFIPGFITGTLIFTAILTTGLLLEHFKMIDPAPLRNLAAKNHLTNPTIFILFALATTFINALLEEYVWRWFVTTRLQALLPATRQFPPLNALTAAAFSALCFTLHHTIILTLYFPPATIVLGSLGVFTGALIWSLHFVRARSILPGYVSHILADVAIFILGWHWIVAWRRQR